MRKILLSVALTSLAFAARAEQSPPPPQVGDTYEITSERDWSRQAGDGMSTGSSSDRDALVERVAGVRKDGLELEYDLPGDATVEDRADDWQFPARLFKPFHGQSQLLNSDQLSARLERWLKAGNLTREACGRWIFTWSAFRIECDPQSVIRIIAQFDLGPDDLAAGVLYKDPKADKAVPLVRKAAQPEGTVYVAEMAVDADAVRHDRAESDVAIAEINRKPVTLDEALRARSADVITGTITTTFDVDPGGRVRRRTTVTKLNIKAADGKSETQTTTLTITRRSVKRQNPDTRLPTV